MTKTDAGDYYLKANNHPLIKVPCGKCPACLKQKRNEWVFRLSEMMRVSTTAYFITLTYDDDHLYYYSEVDGINPTLRKEHVKQFMHNLVNKGNKRWQEHLKKQGLPYSERKANRVHIKYFLVGEYGDQFDRPHYHLIVFDYPADREIITQDCQSLWKKCTNIVDVRYCTGALINYITKYMLKDDDIDYEKLMVLPPFRLMSKGLGKTFVSSATVRRFVPEQKYIDKVGTAYYSIPKYLRDKMEKQYYKKYHDIDPDDKDFYYALGAMRYAKGVEEEAIKRHNLIRAGEALDTLENLDFIMRYHNKLIKQQKKLKRKL